LDGFEATPDRFSTPIADLLASLLTSRDPEQRDGSEPTPPTAPGNPPAHG
jgi:hypothetical protein